MRLLVVFERARLTRGLHPDFGSGLWDGAPIGIPYVVVGTSQAKVAINFTDYGSESDPLANIRQGAEFVGIEAWRGCMVRVADKVQRLRTFCRTGRLVHEGVRDTLLDLAAYSLLAIVLFDEGRNA